MASLYAVCTASRALRASCALVTELVEVDRRDGPANDRGGVDGGNGLTGGELGGTDGRDWSEERLEVLACVEPVVTLALTNHTDALNIPDADEFEADGVVLGTRRAGRRGATGIAA